MVKGPHHQSSKAGGGKDAFVNITKSPGIVLCNSVLVGVQGMVHRPGNKMLFLKRNCLKYSLKSISQII